MVDPLELRLIALEVAKEAGEIALRRRREGVTIAASKSSIADIVTAADREVEQFIAERLAKARPGDAFVGEEGGEETGESGVTWIVDPIDGTVNYAYGMPSYAVSIAAVTDGLDREEWTPLAGVVVAPALGEVYDAALGEGARLDGQRIRVSEPGPAGALIATGFGYDKATHPGALAEISRIMPFARDLRRAGAASLDLAFVAAGRLDAYGERGLQLWDFAAGALLVTEAGGEIVHGNTDAFGRRLLVAGSSQLVEDLRVAFEGE